MLRTGCELQTYPGAFKTEAEWSLIAELQLVQKSEFLQAEKLSCIEAKFSSI